MQFVDDASEVYRCCPPGIYVGSIGAFLIESRHVNTSSLKVPAHVVTVANNQQQQPSSPLFFFQSPVCAQKCITSAVLKNGTLQNERGSRRILHERCQKECKTKRSWNYRLRIALVCASKHKTTSSSAGMLIL